MKKLSILLLTLVSLFTMSCSNSDEAPEQQPEIPEEIVDDFKLLSVNSAGKIFEIGNNSGQITTVGQISTVANLLQLSTICQIDSKIYGLESSYAPAPNIMIVYDKITGTTTSHQLVLPPSVSTVMNDPFIKNLEFDGSQLIAIVSENMPSSNHPVRVISINPQNLQTTDLNISFFQRSLTSTELIGNKLYISTRTEGLLELDLVSKTITELQSGGNRINGTRLAKLSNTKLGLMRFNVPNVVNGIKPFEFDLSTNLLSDKSAGNFFALGNVTGGTIFYNEYLNFVYDENADFGILKINYSNNEKEFIEISGNITGSSTLILDIIE